MFRELTYLHYIASTRVSSKKNIAYGTFDGVLYIFVSCFYVRTCFDGSHDVLTSAGEIQF